MEPVTEPSAVRRTVIVPIYNEAENVRELARRILEVVRTQEGMSEVIFIDDGSRDGSREILREIAQQEPEVQVILFRRNHGQSAAMTAGFEHARGDLVYSMDGDLQNDPADIPHLEAKLEEGYDVVCGWRQNRQDKWVSRKLPSKVANWLIARNTGVRLHDYGCSLKAYRREFVQNLTLYGELHRFIPVLVSEEGARIAELPVKHYPRTAGSSKYGISRLPRVILDLMLMSFFQRFATRPMQFFGRWGGGFFTVGVLLGMYLTAVKIGLGQEIGDRPLLQLAVLLMLFGANLMGIGVLAELVTRVRYESTGRRIYTVGEVIR